MIRTPGRRPLSAAGYARAIERLWADASERAVVLSPRDWALISDWHAREIPLDVVREAIDDAVERGARRRSASPAPRRFSYIAPAVEEAWKVILEGRVSAPHAPPPDAPSGGDTWRERLRSAPAEGPLAGLLRRLVAELEAGTPERELEDELDAALPDAAPPEVLDAVERDVLRRMSGFRERLTPEVFESTRRTAVISGLRRRLGLARGSGELGD